jgi:hypothetical protein
VFDEHAVRRWLQAAGFAVETARAYGDTPLLPRRVAFFATRAAVSAPGIPPVRG